MRKISLVVIIFILVFSGCAQTPVIEVDSIELELGSNTVVVSGHIYGQVDCEKVDIEINVTTVDSYGGTISTTHWNNPDNDDFIISNEENDFHMFMMFIPRERQNVDYKIIATLISYPEGKAPVIQLSESYSVKGRKK